MFHFKNSSSNSIYFKRYAQESDFYFGDSHYKILDMYKFEEGYSFDIVGLFDFKKDIEVCNENRYILDKMDSDYIDYDIYEDEYNFFENVFLTNQLPISYAFLDGHEVDQIGSNSGSRIPEIGVGIEEDAYIAEFRNEYSFLHDKKIPFFYKRIYLTLNTYYRYDFKEIMFFYNERPVFSRINLETEIDIFNYSKNEITFVKPETNEKCLLETKMYLKNRGKDIQFTCSCSPKLSEKESLAIKLLSETKDFKCKLITELDNKITLHCKKRPERIKFIIYGVVSLKKENPNTIELKFKPGNEPEVYGNVK